MRMFGTNWAQPVTNKRWAFVCTILSNISRLSGYRILNYQKHVAWEKACGLS